LEEQSEYRVGSPFAAEPPTAANDNETTQSGSVGSPFAAAPSVPSNHSSAPEALGDGVWGQTTESAVFAAIFLSVFAAACWFFFPPGGIAVTSLGIAISMLAMASRRTKLATAMLVTHGALFILCYLSSI